MKKPYELPYYKTDVSIRDTQLKIEKLLDKYNLIGTQITRYGNKYILIFALEKDGFKFPFRFEIELPNDEQFARQKFRAFYWHLKSRLEAVDFGLFTLQEIFMPELLIKLPNGNISTVKQALQQPNQKLLEIDENYFEK